MTLDDVLTSVREVASVRRVFGEPVEKDGVTVIPAASVGGGGGGKGQDKDGQEGEGGGLGGGGRPVGAYTITAGTLRWVPAIDVNRLVSTIGAVVVVWLLARVRIAKLRAKADSSSR